MKTRRGLSTVVGMVFSIIALTTTVAYVSYSMNSLNQYNQTVLTKNQQLGNAASEKFQISSVTTPNSKLNITLANTGNLPINFTKIWVQNTSATNWVNSYTPPTPKGFVSPGATLTNLGQNIGVYINPTKSYNVKLVTSKGNAQTFSINSASAQPLNIQLFSTPSSVDVGFKSTLIMVVTNNSTGTLVNVTPNTMSQTGGSASCSVGQPSPTSYSTLQPGSTAIFQWQITATSGSMGQTCIFTVSPALQNGYAQSMSATVTISLVTFAQTNLAANTGLLTLNYTTFRWAESTQGTSWNQGFSYVHGSTIAFKLNMTNNNATGTFYVAQKTTLLYYSTHISPSQQPTPFYIVNYTNPATMASTTYNGCNGVGDYCLAIPPGTTATLYLAASTRGTNTAQNFGSADINTAFLLVFGKYSPSQSANAREYAQNIPYIAADVT